MAKNLAQVLKADIPRLPLRKAAEELRKKGRGRDTILAHITPREAAKLKAEGGSGTINPDTGLPEFEDGFDFGMPTFDFFGGYGPDADYQSADVPLPLERPSDLELAQYNPQTYGAGLGEYTPASALSNIVPGVSQGMAETYAGGVPADNLYTATQLAGRGAENIPFPVARPADLQFAGRQDVPGLNQLLAFAGPQTGAAGDAVAAINRAAPGGAAAAARDIEGYTPEERAAEAERVATEELEGKPIDLTSKAAGAAGIQTPLGNLGLKEALLLGGLGLGGFNYLRSQQQAKQNAQNLQAAYDTARQQIQPAYAQAAQDIPAAYTQAAQNLQQLAAPQLQQAATLYGQSQTGALGPAYQQELDAARAAAAQSQERAGGVGAAQAQRSVEDTRQRLLASQQQYANSLFGVANPLISSAIQQQLAGEVAGIQTGLQGVTQGAQLGLQGTTGAQRLQLQMAQNAGTAATGMLSALAALYSSKAA
jgi:hypothetical protein